MVLFYGLIQQDLDKVKEHWNSHCIGGSRYDTVKERPSELFYLPELHNTEHFLAPVSAQQGDYITEKYLALAEGTNEYQGYFQYAFHAAGLSNPQTWRVAFDLYRSLYTYASSFKPEVVFFRARLFSSTE